MDTGKNAYDRAREIVEQILDVMFMQQKKDTSRLQEWITSDPASEEVAGILSDPDLLNERLKKFCRPEKYEKTQLLMEKISRRRIKKRVIRYSGVAASVLLGLLLVLGRGKENAEPEPLAIGQGVPTLILANGEQLDLTTIQQDLLVGEGIHIRPNAAYGLTYVTEDKGDVSAGGEQLNRLVIPRQCTYRVVLSDGSVVHLNAESELEYPAKFIGKERRLTLKGEAYFEVVHDTCPFVVYVGEARIKVYGTKFGINAYSPDCLETVLVEGKVGVSVKLRTDQEKILYPSQLSQMNMHTGEQLLSEVRVEKYISWISGVLRYEGDLLQEVMEDLSRWYGADLIIDDPRIRKMKVTASINKDLSLAEIIVMMKTTLNVEFLKTEGGYRIVLK